MTKKFFPALLLALVPAVTLAQAVNPANEGGEATQTLLRADSKHGAQPTLATTTVEVNGHSVPLAGLAAVQPGNTQVALLIDDGLGRSAGIQLQDMRQFVQALPAGTEVFVGYMSNGRILQVQSFTTDHAAAAKTIRLPSSLPGQSASPYFCLSDFVKHWPTGGEHADLTKPQAEGLPLKARFVMMITNGVDPYNGSVSITNQNSPYVDAAVRDAQRAGVAVYAIYYSDAGMGGGAASFSGQSYLVELAEATGGQSLYQGSFNPVSLKPYFSAFQRAMTQSYIATFPAGTESAGHDRLVRLKVSTSLKGLKLRAASEVMPGTLETTVRQ